MRPLSFLLKHTSPSDLAREAVWRIRRRVRRARRMAELRRDERPVTFRNIPYYAAGVPDLPARAHAAILEMADQVRRGRFALLGFDAADLGSPPKWNADFVSGYEWNCASGPYVRHDGADVKVPWELSRLQYAPVLAKAWRLTKDDAYRTAAMELIDDWIGRNPVGHGVTWAIAMEAALRGMSMCFSVNLLWPITPDEQSWLDTVTRSLWQHLLFVEANIEFSYIVCGNHYLSDIVGLLCLAHFLEGRGMARRRRLYQGCIEREMQHQVYADGGSFEASTGYHLFAFQLFSTARLLMRASELHPAAAFEQRLCRMFDFLNAAADDHGRVPQIGDCDDGRVELTSDDICRLLRPSRQRDALACGALLGLGAALCSRPAKWPQYEAAWYGVAPGQQTPPAPAPVEAFPQAGLAVARTADAQLWFANFPNGIGGKGSHTHNDKLSFVLRVGGHELFCDWGTACYTRDAALRNRFRSTAAHNTVMIDAAEQNEFSLAPEFLFCLEDQAGVTPVEGGQTGGEIVLRSSHSGYARIGVIHERRLALATTASQFYVEDRLEGGGEHTFELLFHLAPEWSVCAECITGETVSCVIAGPTMVRLDISAPAPLLLRSERVDISRAYGALLPAARISVTGRAQLPVTLMSRISWTPATVQHESLPVSTELTS